MRCTVCILALALVSSACKKDKTCTPKPVDGFISTSVPNAELAAALTELAGRGKVCEIAGKSIIVMSGSRSDAVEAMDAIMKKNKYPSIPGRERAEGSAFVFGYAKTKDEKTGDLVELSVTAGDDCYAGDVCVENLGYTVVPR